VVGVERAGEEKAVLRLGHPWLDGRCRELADTLTPRADNRTIELAICQWEIVAPSPSK